jgi:hypothetical protein
MNLGLVLWSFLVVVCCTIVFFILSRKKTQITKRANEIVDQITTTKPLTQHTEPRTPESRRSSNSSIRSIKSIQPEPVETHNQIEKKKKNVNKRKNDGYQFCLVPLAPPTKTDLPKVDEGQEKLVLDKPKVLHL